jgi:hypothetical protein
MLRFVCVLATILISAKSLKADTIISVTGAPGLSTLIGSGSPAVSTFWAQSNAYTGVAVAVLVNISVSGGQSATADAYLSTRIGPGTTVADEIAHTGFTVPAIAAGGGDVCSPQGNCGSIVTLFSGLSLGPGTYFLTLSSTARSSPLVGWFPALTMPTVLQDTGVAEGFSYYAPVVGSYAPASVFQEQLTSLNNSPLYTFSMSFAVTGTAVNAVPEPALAALVGLGALLIIIKGRHGTGRIVDVGSRNGVAGMDTAILFK